MARRYSSAFLVSRCPRTYPYLDRHFGIISVLLLFASRLEYCSNTLHRQFKGVLKGCNETLHSHFQDQISNCYKNLSRVESGALKSRAALTDEAALTESLIVNYTSDASYRIFRINRLRLSYLLAPTKATFVIITIRSQKRLMKNEKKIPFKPAD